MKIKIDGKYMDIDFWSFLKCHILVELVILGIVYALIGFTMMLLL